MDSLPRYSAHFANWIARSDSSLCFNFNENVVLNDVGSVVTSAAHLHSSYPVMQIKRLPVSFRQQL